jgi:EF hand
VVALAGRHNPRRAASRRVQGGKADASGLTPAQQKGFKEYDLNGDGKITRDEVETRVAPFEERLKTTEAAKQSE